jgi:hypothetical protein
LAFLAFFDLDYHLLNTYLTFIDSFPFRSKCGGRSKVAFH